MKTELLTAAETKRAGEILRSGGLVAFPTETVYGLGADARNADAVRRIFAAKGRPADNPLIVHIARMEQLDELVTAVPKKAKALMERFWSGPLTLIFDKSDLVPDVTSGGLRTVAVRMPSHPVARELLLAADCPVAAPSANLSGRPSPTTFAHVRADMEGRIEGIIDGGSCEVGVESTVLDVRGDTPWLLRPGGITKEMIEEIVGEVRCQFAVSEEGKPSAPGMKYRHYAPKAPLTVVRGSFDGYLKTLHGKIGILVTDEEEYGEEYVVQRLGSDPNEQAMRLFSCLRAFDDAGVTEIAAKDVGEDGISLAVRNRLYKAAGNRVITYDKD